MSKQNLAYTFLLYGIQGTSRVDCEQYLSDNEETLGRNTFLCMTNFFCAVQFGTIFQKYFDLVF